MRQSKLLLFFVLLLGGLTMPVHGEGHLIRSQSNQVIIEFTLNQPAGSSLYFSGSGKDPETGEYFQFTSIGIPDAAAPSTTIESVEWIDAGHSAAEALPSGGTSRITATGWVRSQRIAGIAFFPYRSRSGRLEYARKARIRVSWNTPSASKRTTETVKNEPVFFEKHFQSTILNYEQAKGFRAVQATGMAKTLSSGGEVKVRINITQKGMYRISYSDLENAGIRLDAQKPENFRITSNGKEIPIWIEGGEDGRFNSGDAVIFYGTYAQDSVNHFSQYTFTNVYWLSWNSGIGLRYVLHRVTPRELSYSQQFSMAPDFYDTVHVEFDNEVRFFGDVEVPQSFSLDEIEQPEIDFWYWDYIGKQDQTSISFHIPPPAQSQTAKFRIFINLFGLTSNDNLDPDHNLDVLLNDRQIFDGNGNGAAWDRMVEHTFLSREYENSYLEDGNIRINLKKRNPGQPDYSALNWIKVAYWRKRKAEKNVCFFKSGADTMRGLYEFKVEGFSRSDLDLWDLSGRKLEGTRIESPSDTAFSLVFLDSITQRSEYVALSQRKYLQPDTILLDTASTLKSPDNSADLIILTNHLLKDSLGELVSLRESQGYTVKVVDVQDVYDEFNFGVLDPHAIREMVRYAIAEWSRAPVALLIIGDTTHDFDKKNKDRNIVPTFLTHVPSWGPASSDDWFTTVAGNDILPDILVGRIPVATGEELQSVIGKIVSNEKNTVYNTWRDKFLLIGGFETEFEKTNNHLSTGIIRDRYHQERMEMNKNSDYYYGTNSTRHLISLLNSGVSLISFSGHGGGNIWSDNYLFSIEDIDQLYNRNRYPSIFSFTCLTGFFESSEYASLGENILRVPEKGALSFYGASGYVAAKADEALSEQIMNEIIGNKTPEIGSVILNAETNMILKYGAKYALTTQQYNLLGDPLGRMNYPQDDLDLKSPARYTIANDTLFVSCKNNLFSSGYIKTGLYDNTALLESNTFSFGDDSISFSFSLKPGTVISNGCVRAYAWNDTADNRGSLSFSHNKLHVGKVWISAAEPMPQDTLYVYTSIYDHPPEDSLRYLRCFYGMGIDSATDSRGEVGMSAINDTLYKSRSSIALPSVVNADEKFWVTFRYSSTAATEESDRYSFTLKRLPDLRPLASNPVSLSGLDTLWAVCRIINEGLEPAEDPVIQLNIKRDDDSVFTKLDEKSFSGSLAAGHADSVVFAIPEQTGKFVLRVTVDPDQEIQEYSIQNNSAEKSFELNRAEIATVRDTLYSLDSNVMVTLIQNLEKSRIFSLTGADTAGKTPSRQGMAYCPLVDSGGTAYSIKSAPLNDSVANIIFFYDSLRAESLLALQYPDSCLLEEHLGIYKWADTLNRWVWQKEMDTTGILSLKTDAFSDFCAGLRYDQTAPSLEVTAKGRPLTFTDYIPIGHPIDIYIKDEAGIDITSFTVTANGEIPDTSKLRYDFSGNSPRTLIGTYFPGTTSGIDSLSISVKDVNGNRTERTIRYLLGDALDIQVFANYPNPFVDETVIVFSITDACSEARLELYTIAGRRIRTWNLIDEFGINMIGYHELKWDGKDRDGYRVSNGTYFLKLKIDANSGNKEKFIPIVKLKGY